MVSCSKVNARVSYGWLACHHFENTTYGGIYHSYRSLLGFVQCECSQNKWDRFLLHCLVIVMDFGCRVRDHGRVMAPLFVKAVLFLERNKYIPIEKCRSFIWAGSDIYSPMTSG